MRVKTISRVEQDYTKELRSDKLKVHRNLDPALHPFERAREYTRALNSVKLDKVFAKPFVGALDGHCDGVSALSASPTNLVAFISGACDGEIRVWDLPNKKCVWNVYGHSGFVRGITVEPTGQSFFTCSDDKTIKKWGLCVREFDDDRMQPDPIMTYLGKESFNGIDHNWTESVFATCGGQSVSIWDHTRSEPLQSHKWGSDSVTSVKYNPSEVNLLASTGSDRSIGLYDTRLAESMRKVVLNMRSNALAWNPMEPFNFTVANEDHNLYSFDMRNLKKATTVHKDHVSSVMDVAYSPTGQEFVSGSYDRTVRIFSTRSAKSREVYHTKRMQRIFAVKFSADAKFVLSGSDDTNIRLWKANASMHLGTMAPRARRTRQYNESLKDRFKHLPEIKRIAKHRHVPKGIMKAQKAKMESNSKEMKKVENRKRHAAEGSIETKSMKKKSIIKELE